GILSRRVRFAARPQGRGRQAVPGIGRALPAGLFRIYRREGRARTAREVNHAGHPAAIALQSLWRSGLSSGEVLRLPWRFRLFGGALLLCAAVFPPRASGQEKIRLSHSALEANNAIWYIAKDLGFYKKNGLDAELLFIPSTTTSVVSLVSGDVQL